MSMFGGGFGGFNPGGRPSMGAAGRKGNGLPFAGIPPDLAEGVAKLEAREPGHGDPQAPFDPVADTGRKVTLLRLVIGRKGLLVAALLAILVETLLLQAGPYLVQVGIDHGIAARNVTVLSVATGAFVAAVLLTGLATAVRMRQSGRLAASATRDLRIRIFAHLQRMSLDYYTSEKAGVTMTRMTSDVESLQSLLADGFAQFVIQALTMVVVTGVLFHYNAGLAVITLLLVVPPLLLASLWFRRAADQGYNRQRDAIATMFADLSESLNGVRVVTAHNRQDRNIVAHREVVGGYRDANDFTGRINAVYGPGTSVIGLLGMAALLLIGGRMVLRGELSIGELTAFVLYLNAFFQPVQQLVQLYTQYQQARAAVGKINGLLGTPSTIVQRPSATDLPPVRGEIVFSDVTFAYVPGRPVLSGVNLHIAPGETVACVGPTGAGKSTLAKLVTRLYDPTAGAILIDGYDLRDVTLASLRRQIGVVPQEPFLFAGTLRDNIAFARPTTTDAEVWAAVDAVGLRDLVERSPEGLLTPLHERGQSVSSGERQLLALARAFLAEPRVVVLDEATSSLDLNTELRVEAALDRLLQGRTAILVAHRLSTAMRADRIIVVDNHQILETGTHTELLSANGPYAHMYATWSSHSTP
ncbi:ABC transporter ATP-binding protein [Actinoplanes friuliensis]|uniref:Lipid A export ATP-binding/permease protein msbA n=1 Tax=Actinoplanes friuliensis DSM 7358 TaxID=1246995 RepID=U5W9F6_9ACTN|nr:ABC transporter ATP-binding protein [Actinoplanes friuliensis]AGZ44605.1 Lipid A export ATP-binding/permease protein msbA [Actinoplanes friuliensis DSM 7358]